MKFAIIVAEFNEMITGRMLEECLRGFAEQDIEPMVLKVPGAVEIPLAAQKLIEQHADGDDEIVAVVALGCVVKGETEHYGAVCDMCSKGIMDVMLKTGVPIVFEVLMADTYQKVESRIDKGYHAAFVATRMAA